MKMALVVCIVGVALALGFEGRAADVKEQLNSIGMKLIRIEPGSFVMGQAKGGDFDERPVHKVTIGKAFHIAATEVTNAQYERFDPGHKKLRGKKGVSKGDDEAVVYVSWHDAAKFCEWLSKKDCISSCTSSLTSTTSWSLAM